MSNTPPVRRRPLAAALALLLAAALPAVPAHAQETPQQARRTYAIAAGPLEDALTRFAATAGIALSFDPALVAGLRSAGLNGSHTGEEGLNRVLQGSGLAPVKRSDGSYTLRKLPPSAAGETTLAPVTVTAATERIGVTEGTGSYTTNASSTATKLNLTPRETPQTLTVVTRQKIDDFGLTSVNEVLESTSAVFHERAGINGPTYFSRGFLLQSQYDGIPNPIGIGGNDRAASPDTAFLDKVEILQGSSGLMAGAGEPGGTINLVRKRPTEQTQAHVEATLGSWDKQRLVADVSGSLIESRRIRGRLVALVDNSDSYTNYVFDDKRGFYGIVEADVTAATTLGASVMYQKNEFNDHYGVPMGPDGTDLGLPRSSFYGLKNGDGTRESTSYTLTLDQKLPAGWLLKAAYTHSDNEVANKITSYVFGALDADTGDGLNLYRTFGHKKTRSNVLDVYAAGPFPALGRQHEIVVGATISEMKEDSAIRLPYTQSPINIYNYDVDSIARPTGALPNARRYLTAQKGAYAATRLDLADSLKLILGARTNWYEYKTNGVTDQKEDDVVTPYAGLIYDIDKSTSVYASYSDIFKPQSNLRFGGGTIDPIVGKNYEIGTKSELLQGRFNTSAAVFRLEQTNLSEVDSSVPTTACSGGQCYKSAGLVVSNGIDLGINGEILKGWQIGAGYTYVDSEYGNGSQKGQAYGTNRPQHILRAHTAYLIPGTNWAVGGNIRAQSRMYTEKAAFRTEQGGYAVVGLMARYRINKQAEFGLTVNNLFDQRYYDAIGPSLTTLGNFYGAPRNILVSLKYDF